MLKTKKGGSFLVSPLKFGMTHVSASVLSLMVGLPSAKALKRWFLNNLLTLTVRILFWYIGDLYVVD